MCYEYSDWAWKARAAELAKKDRKTAESEKKAERKDTQPEAEPPKPRETVPA